MIMDILTPKIARSVLSDVIDAAMNYVYYTQMVGIESDSGDDLEEALSHIPCLYCGVIAFSHDDDCPRHIFRDKLSMERT